MNAERQRRTVAGLALAVAGAVALADVQRPTFVFCAPGSPGSTAEAQPTMDAFAAAVSARAGLAVAATYAPTDEGGVARLQAPDAAVAVVSLPFLLAHEQRLTLRPELQPVLQDGVRSERWALVARKGRVANAAALAGFTILSTAGFAPGFVRGPALAGWGKLPASTHVAQSTAILSGLRRAAAGEPVAVLLDGAQSAALATLPFASDLEVVARSPALPVGVVATVGRRITGAQWAKLGEALRALSSDPAASATLAGIRMSAFEAVDAAALAAARSAYREVSR